MKSVLIDTNVLISFLERSQKTLGAVLSAYDELVVTPTILGEFRAGLGSDRKGEGVARALEAFLSLDSVRVLPITDQTAVFYAKIFRALKGMGRPIPTNDIWIAASAMASGIELCSFDAHFEIIPMLQLRHL